MALAGRVALLAVRLVGFGLWVYAGLLSAGNIPNTLARRGPNPVASPYVDWGGLLVLGAGVVPAIFFAYRLLRGSDPGRAWRDVALAYLGLAIYAGLIVLAVATAP